ncbi:hypothetical protein ACHAPJ_010381 [Fusarium lateritium]
MVNPPHNKLHPGTMKPHHQPPATQHHRAPLKHHPNSSTHHQTGHRPTAHQPPHHHPAAPSVVHHQPSGNHGMHMTPPAGAHHPVHRHSQTLHGHTGGPHHGHAGHAHTSHAGSHPGHSSSHPSHKKAAASGAVAGAALGGAGYYLYSEPNSDDTEEAGDFSYGPRYDADDYAQNYGNGLNDFNDVENNGNEGNGLVEYEESLGNNFPGGLSQVDYSAAHGGDDGDCYPPPIGRYQKSVNKDAIRSAPSDVLTDPKVETIKEAAPKDRPTEPEKDTGESEAQKNTDEAPPGSPKDVKLKVDNDLADLLTPSPKAEPAELTEVLLKKEEPTGIKPA